MSGSESWRNIYTTLRDEISVGDVIAFGGKGKLMDLIRWAGDTPYSHVAIVIRGFIPATHRNDIATGLAPKHERVLICESTTLIDLPDLIHREVRKGVQIQALSQRLDGYNGDAWHVPIDEEFEAHNIDEMLRWIMARHAARTPYDTTQALGAGIDFWDRVAENREDFSKLFCSELVCKCHQILGFAEGWNPSETQPYEVVEAPWMGEPTQIKGDAP
jgi:hypothetical protein